MTDDELARLIGDYPDLDLGPEPVLDLGDYVDLDALIGDYPELDLEPLPPLEVPLVVLDLEPLPPLDRN